MTDPTPAEVIADWRVDRPTRAEIVDEAIEGLRADLRTPPAADAGEVRTYREGVEDAAKVAEEQYSDSAWMAEYRNASIVIAAAIRKLGS